MRWPFEEMQLYGTWLALPVFSNAVEAIVDQNLLKHEYPVNSGCEVARRARNTTRQPFERSENVVQMLESSDKLHTKSEK